jgi:hypothetical protein
MDRSAPFRLNRSGLLLALVSAAFAGPAAAAAGRVDFAVGDATVVGSDGRDRPLTRGSELDTGDTVRTNDGRVQVRMTDGAFISLQPNTEFGIKNYRFEGKTDGSENAFYSLAKGAMRTVTGLIGRVNRNRYQVGTPTATVGIRGTGGVIQVLPDGSTLVQGTSGIWFLANPSGSIDVPAGVSGLAPSDPKQPPQETAAVPTAGPTPPTKLVEYVAYVQGNERTPNGTAVITPPAGVLLSGSGYAAVLAYGVGPDPAVPTIDSGVGIATFVAGQLTQMAFSGRAASVYTLGGSQVDAGTDGILAWGRWIGPVTVPGIPQILENYNGNQGLHYVVGMPTASMPKVGTATYTLLGATQPTYTDGSAAPGKFSGSLSVDFGQLKVGMNLNVGMSDGKGYAIGGFAPITGNQFAGTSSTGLAASGTAGGACGTSGCTALVNGFFAGASAERAGLGYHIKDSFAGKDVIGAAAFKQ